MPHTVFDIGIESATADLVPNQILPGVEPGMGIKNIFEQKRMKPAMLLNDAYVEVADFITSAAADIVGYRGFLKLSQSPDLNPGLILPIFQFVAHQDGTTADVSNAMVSEQMGQRLAGTVWCPRYLGVRVEEIGNGSSINVQVHVDWTAIEIPWMEWFIRWDFLDNIIDNSRDY